MVPHKTGNKSIVEAEEIFRKFDRKEVLKGASLHLRSEEIFGLVGLNGAGKTTFIRILLGLLKADKGSCKVLGMNPVLQEKKYYRRIGIVLEHNGFYGNLTVRENLRFYAEARGISRESADEYFSQYWSDSAIGKETKKVKLFSRGQKMQCALCRAFLGWPEMFFFDEPVVALDIEAYDHFCEMTHKANSQGATIIISSHQLDTIEDLCTSVGILENGKLTQWEGMLPEENKKLWHIKTDFREEYRGLIKGMGGEFIQYQKGEWVFSIEENAVPRLVSKLVGSGAEIYKVGPLKDSLRKSIKKHYKENK